MPLKGKARITHTHMEREKERERERERNRESESMTVAAVIRAHERELRITVSHLREAIEKEGRGNFIILQKFFFQ
jgi:hypothetical protein